MMITFKVCIQVSYIDKIFNDYQVKYSYRDSNVLYLNFVRINLTFIMLLISQYKIYFSKLTFVARIVLPSLFLHNHNTDTVIILQNDILVLLV
jgi:hypothetical protein